MYSFKLGMDLKEYDTFAVHHPLYNLLQSSNWSRIKESWGNERVGLYKGNILVGVASILIKYLPLGFTMMYIPRGPLLDYKNEEEVIFFMKELKKYAKSKRCLFVKMDPGIHINDYKIEDANDRIYDVSIILKNMRDAGTKHLGYPKRIGETIQARYQACIYRKENYMDELPKHTKRLIKKAKGRGVQIQRVGIDELDQFSDLVSMTEERKQVSLRNKEYFKLLMDTFQADCWLYLATLNIKGQLMAFQTDKVQNDRELSEIKEESRKKRNQLLEKKESLDQFIEELKQYEKKYGEECAVAGVLSIRYGNTLEALYAGMNDDFKKMMPQYDLYAGITQTAFDEGIEYVNFGGVEGDLQDGLTKFKANFDPMINEFIGEFDLPTSIFYPLGKKAFEMYRKKAKD